jgi:hypothetical protein
MPINDVPRHQHVVPGDDTVSGIMEYGIPVEDNLDAVGTGIDSCRVAVNPIHRDRGRATVQVHPC